MIKTNLTVNLDEKISVFVKEFSSSLEEYLPDEKISSKWEEVEVLCSNYPDFETVFFRYDLDGMLIVVSSDFEFFPLYVLHLVDQHNWPQVAVTGKFGANEYINLDENEEVLLFGFSQSADEDKLIHSLPNMIESQNLDLEFLQTLSNEIIADLLSY